MRLNGSSNRKVSRQRQTSKEIVRLEAWRENPGVGAISVEGGVELQKWDEITKMEV